MSKSKVDMPKDLKKKCHVAIHAATTAAAAAGAIPIPMSDAIPITTVQIGMIVAIGKAFGITLTVAASKSFVSVTLAQGVGRTIFANALKVIPGAGTMLGGVIGAVTAAALTEALGWMVADDFFRMANGEEPKDIVDVAGVLSGAFNGCNWSK